MKTPVLFIAFALQAFLLNAQIDPRTPWTWMKGDNTVDHIGIYGSKGVESSNNKPGSRNFSVTWTDRSGNLWLFGGSGYATGDQGFLNDLWKFSTTTYKWTWVKGDSTLTQNAVYGTQGTAAANNKPGPIYSGVSWTDTTGNLWMFGGYGYQSGSYGYLNALWKYNTTTNHWTWVKGDNLLNKTGVYGTKGTEHINNNPGARYGSVTWRDASGNLWLFGGYGYNSTSSGILNDLWKYNPATNKWTWISGDNALESTAVYGTKGTAVAGNKPGARYVSASWIDADGYFWIFGGYGYDAANCGNLNDLWKYNPATNQWTWVSGDNQIDQSASYGIQGTSSPTNKPGGRYVGSGWTDPNGELWMFGGYGIDANGSTGYLNDFWKYSPYSNTWTWVKGNNKVDQLAIYGTQGLADTTNISGARQGSVSWTDNSGSLWLFGGYGFDGSTTGILNDLWKINSYNVVLPIRLLQFSGTLNNGTSHLKWVTEQEAGFSHFSIQRSFDGSLFTTIGEVNANGGNNRSEYNYTDAGLAHQSETKVYYRLQLNDQDGRFSYSKVIMFDLEQKPGSVRLFPNPAVNSLTASIYQEKAGTALLLITDMKGTIVKKYNQSLSAGNTSMAIDCSHLSSATYLLSLLMADGSRINEKLVIRH